ncbi:MAG: N-acetylglucosamine-6-phosphate deacetylase [Armatimonadota bacterium]
MIQAEDVMVPGRPAGFVVIEGDRIERVEEGSHPHPDLDGADGSVAAAGFIDLQINGAAGCDFLSPMPDGLAAAHAYLLRTGTVAYLPTLISAPEERTRAALAFFAEHARRPGAPRILGVHLEGPFLSPARPGAHNPRYLRTPSVEWIGRLLDDFPGLIRLVTLAPELDGALEVIDMLASRGIVVALGHSDATYAQAMAAFDRGARLATHLFNAMRPYHHREPGLVGAALAHGDTFCSLIADFVHVHPAVVLHVIALKPFHTVLVTDAIAAAGVGAATSTLGDQTVSVRNGAPRLADGTLAGSILAMDQAVRNAAAPDGTHARTAVVMATTTPAEVLGLKEGAIAPGNRADLVILDRNLEVLATIVSGQIVYQRR